MNRNLDNLIKLALADKNTPNNVLNRQILRKAKENTIMKRHILKKAVAAAACIGLAALSSISVYAAYRYLSPSQIVNRVSSNTALADVFESEDSIVINETQSTNGYTITLLALVSGVDLQLHVPEDISQPLSPSNTYAVVAIEKADGSEMEYKDFCISPLINGLDFMVANNATLNTLLSFFEENGILYHFIECDNLEIFADRGVQLAVVDHFGQETQAFYMDQTTGIYHKQEGYDKTNALFTLPLDKTKADTNAADEYIQHLITESEETTENSEQAPLISWEVSLFIRSLTPETITDYFERDDGTELTTFPDENGWIEFGTTYIEKKDYWYEGDSGYIEYMIDDGENFATRGYGYSAPDLSDLSVKTVWRNEDGSFTSVIYRANTDLSFLLE